MTFGLQMLASAGGPRITLSNVNVDASALNPDDALAVYQLENDGDVNQIVNGVTTDLSDWMVPKVSAFASQFEVFATLNSGSLTGGTTGSWLGLGTTRSWTRGQDAIGASTAQLGIQIRRVGTSNVLASCTVNLSATVDAP
jgi:hypothetical protein